jgi:hypothetical protein
MDPSQPKSDGRGAAPRRRTSPRASAARPAARTLRRRSGSRPSAPPRPQAPTALDIREAPHETERRRGGDRDGEGGEQRREVVALRFHAKIDTGQFERPGEVPVADKRAVSGPTASRTG